MASRCMISVSRKGDRGNGRTCGQVADAATSRGFFWILTLIFVYALPLQAASCESLSMVAQPKATITSAQMVAAGQFVPPGGDARAAEAFRNLAAFCRISVTSRPSADSDIRIEVWLPSTD